MHDTKLVISGVGLKPVLEANHILHTYSHPSKPCSIDSSSIMHHGHKGSTLIPFLTRLCLAGRIWWQAFHIRFWHLGTMSTFHIVSHRSLVITLDEPTSISSFYIFLWYRDLTMYIPSTMWLYINWSFLPTSVRGILHVSLSTINNIYFPLFHFLINDI